MVFTVLRYLPILEEETPGHSIEMAKKAKSDTSGDDDDSGDGDDRGDDDGHEKGLFQDAYNFQLSALSSEHYYYIKHEHCCLFVPSIQTPPPKA